MSAEDKRDDILRKVQALLAKANSTPFEAEADTFRAKASEMMDKYRIEQWEIAKREQGMAKVANMHPIRVDVPIPWYWDDDHRYELWQIFMECSRLCAVVVANMKLSGTNRTAPCYGTQADIGFMQMLFTDLYIQMSGKIKPVFDPSKPLGWNVYNAKEAGMKYHDIAIWAGHPEWIKVKGYGRRGSPLYEYNGIMIREMRKHAALAGLEIHKEINLDAYIEDFVESYTFAVTGKMKEMRTGEARNTGGMDLVIRDITDQAREMMLEDYPDLTPHPDDCDCDLHHRCSDINCLRPGCHERNCENPNCMRPRCIDRRKPIKIRKSMLRERNVSVVAQARGAQAGASAKILSRSESVQGKRPPSELK